MPQSGEPQTRTYGQLPEGSQVNRTELNTYTRVEYGEKTWSTGQSVRDILQNHLDANTQVFFDTVVGTVIDVGEPAELKAKLEREYKVYAFDIFTYELFRYQKSWQHMSKESRQEMQTHLSQLAEGLPIKSDLLTPDGQPDWQKIDHKLFGIKEKPPEITFRVIDQNGEEQPQWVTLEEMRSEKYMERNEAADEVDGFRFQIVGVKIKDQGKGFDSKLTAFYKSTKTGKKHLRGKYGEGQKMSEVHLVRHDAKMKMGSLLETQNDQQQKKLRAWQVRPFLGEDAVLYLKGIEAIMPHSEAETGSYSAIDIQNSDPAFQHDFRANIDPRTETGLGDNCLEFSTQRFSYPLGKLESYERPVGISLSGRNGIYVQGLKIPYEPRSMSGNDPYFSYDILSSDVLTGRDRNQVSSEAEYAISTFWFNLDDPRMLNTLATLALKGRQFFVETKAFRDIVTYDEDHLNKPVQKRNHEAIMNLLPDQLGLKAGQKYVFMSDTEYRQSQNQTLLENLAAQNYQIIPLPYMSNDHIETVARKLRTRFGFEIINLDQAKLDLKDIIGQFAETESTPQFREIFATAKSNVESRLTKLGLSTAFLGISDEVQLLQSAESTDPPIDLFWQSENQKFVLRMRPDRFSIILPAEQQYWKERTEALILATFKKNEAFPNLREALQYAQNVSQSLLDLSIETTSHLPSVDEIHLNHQINEKSDDELADGFFQRTEKVDTQVSAWRMIEAGRSLSLDIARFKQLWEMLPTLPRHYREGLKSTLAERVILEGDNIVFVEDDEVQEKSLANLPIALEWEGKPVYLLSEKRAFYPAEVKNGSVVTTNSKTQFVRFGEQMLIFESYRFLAQPYSYPNGVELNGVTIRAGYGKFNANELENKLADIKISNAERSKTPTILQKTEVIPTALPIEYGEREWRNPVRVFQDILQNHLDASGNTPIEIWYKVRTTGAEPRWVKKDELTDYDKIIGFRVTDQGSGYTPNELGLMGNSSKRSPLFAGKYGEGQKMIAAAAARFNFSLSYSSIGEYDGQRHRWTAQVGTQDEELMVGGKTETAKRVVFNSDAIPESESPGYSSSTTVELPDSPSYDQKDEWNTWMDAIDPRQKDARGHAGLERYVLQLRRPSDQVIDMGYMKILLDEPGAVYENGLLIKQENPDQMSFGIDVPDVVNTRERNSFDSSKLDIYIGHALLECKDPRLATAMLNRFKTKYLNDALTTGKVPYTSERDLRFPSASGSFNAARVIWDVANEDILGGLFIHSSEQLEGSIKDLEKRMEEGYTYEDDKRRYARLLQVRANMGHIPQSRLLQPEQFSMYSWESFFPTAEDYLASLDVSAVEVDTETQNQLIHITKTAAEYIHTILQDSLNGTADKFIDQTLLIIMAEYKPDRIHPILENEYNTYSNRKYYTEQALEALEPWLSEEHLRQNPDMVFVAPYYAGYLGLAEPNRLGFNEKLLNEQSKRQLVSVAVHELIHKIFGFSDYTPSFVMMLNRITDQIITQGV